MLLTLSPDSLGLISLLSDQGYKTYAVGGCVRDALMGRPSHDIDLTTQATPDELEAATKLIFRKCGPVNYGTTRLSRYGSNEVIEVTTMRTESDYTDGRRPDTVAFTRDLREDLSRRDFTMNALAYDPLTDKIIDPFGGAQDIEDRVIRAVGDAKVRFAEDGLRIMRAWRFVCTLGFEIEPATERSMRESISMLDNVSQERLGQELMRAFSCDDSRELGYALEVYPDALLRVIPELAAAKGFDQRSPYHDLDLLTHVSYMLELAPKDMTVRLAALLHDVAKPGCAMSDDSGCYHFKGHPEMGAEMADARLKALAIPGEIRDEVSFLVANHESRPAATTKSARKLLRKCGYDRLRTKRLLTLMYLDMRGRDDESLIPEDPEDMFSVLDIATSLLVADESPSKTLAVNGFDLMDIGIFGCEIKHMKKLMEEAIDDELVENDHDALIAFARKTKKEG